MNSILEAPASSPTGAVIEHGEPPRILVVDDDGDVRNLEAAILKRVGHRVDTAEDGESAWQALVGRNYDLLVTDHIMPGESGLALVRRLRVANITLPVVMVSGTLENLDTARLSRDPWSHIHAFVHKPFTQPELLSAVQGALASEFSSRADGSSTAG